MNSAHSDADIGILSNKREVADRVRSVCTEFGYTHTDWKDVDSFLSAKRVPRLTVASLTGDNGDMSVAEMAQVVRHLSSETFLIGVANDSLAKNEATFTKKSGCNLVLLEQELIGTSKFEFIASQVLRTRYLPLKPFDLVPDKPVPFSVYHLLPQRKKFLITAFKDDLISKEKLDKASQVGELYFERDEAKLYNDYLRQHSDRSAAGLAKRCRGQFLALFSTFSTLTFKLTNQSENASFAEGQELLKSCLDLCSELLGTLAETGEPWKIINNSAIGDFGSVERTPAIAAYAGIFALFLEWKGIDQVMLTALLADLGLLFQPSETLRKLRTTGAKALSEEERALFVKYPARSMDLLLDRKLSFPEKQRKWIIQTLERHDGQGFPNRTVSSMIDKESSLIAFSRDFDQRTLIRIGKPRIDPSAELKQMLNEPESVAHYGEALVDSLKKVF